jgi:hypothetical protein
MNTLAPTIETPTTLQRCPKGQQLFQAWSNRVRFARSDNWQRPFFHPTRYGYNTHVKKCLECQAYQNRRKPKEST